MQRSVNGSDGTNATSRNASQANNTGAEIFEDSTDQASLFRVGVRVPPFWPDRPALWFAQIEGQFILSGITADLTKFYYVTSHLDHKFAAEVEDVITNPPAENKYATLKAELIGRLSASQEQRDKQLLAHEELGDRKPTQFLRHLLHLAGPNKLPDAFIRTVWTSRLPFNLQAIVASHPDMPLLKLAELADKIQEYASPGPHIAETSPMPGPSTALSRYVSPPAFSPMETMSLQIAELSRQMAALTTHVLEQKTRPHTRAPKAVSKRIKQTPPAQERKKGVCWYHRRFGALATRCTHPCEYKPEN
ncbi:uncharacterized protein [Choristoneura fumiferana]|uniref:uncharacterized protein n=1 Tax=Choristoneura fumiferana TaxID=7141 RepID=UPI003D1582C5